MCDFMSRQLYMLGFLLLVAGGFLLVYGYLSTKYDWESWGGIIFFVGLFIGVLGVVVPEAKTEIVLKAVGTSLLVMIIFLTVSALLLFVWRPTAQLAIAIPGFLFFFVLITIVAYVLFDLMEKRKLSGDP